MRVWIENPFDNLPAEGFRAQRYWLMACAFASAGYETTLWTSDFNHTTKKRRALKSDSAASGSVPALRIIHAPAYYANVSLRRMWSHFVYAVRFYFAAGRAGAQGGAPGLIVASSPTLCACAAARLLARRYHARFVLDVQDAWPETFERVVPRALLWPLRCLARSNYLAADRITAVAARHIDLVRSCGVRAPAALFYHGIEPRENPSPLPLPATPRRANHDAIALVYAGNLGRTYDIATLISAVESHPAWTLDVAGRGEQEVLFSPQSAAVRSGRIRYHGYLDERALCDLLEKCDIGVVPMAPESCVGVPYKFADYSRAALAIVSSLGGESEELLRRYSCGEGYEPGNAESLADAMGRLIPRLDDAKRASCAMCRAEFDSSKIYPAYANFCLSS